MVVSARATDGVRLRFNKQLWVLKLPSEGPAVVLLLPDKGAPACELMSLQKWPELRECLGGNKPSFVLQIKLY